MALHLDGHKRVNANAAPKKSVGRRIPEGRALAHQAHRPGRGAACLSWRSAPRTMSWQPRVWIAPAHSSLHLVNHPTNGLGQLAAVLDNNVPASAGTASRADINMGNRHSCRTVHWPSRTIAGKPRGLRSPAAPWP